MSVNAPVDGGATMQRELAARIRASLLLGDRHVRRIGLNLVLALNDMDLDVAELLGMKTAYVGPQAAEDRLSAVLDVAARCSWEMSFHRDASVRLWARELTEWLDSAGANIDDRVEALSRRSGKGPTRFDLSGFSYDLTRQYVDERGRRWEHTGDWTNAEVPVMRRDEPDGPAMTLPDLVRDRGPLFAICIPAHSTAGFSDEPPF